MSAPPPPTPLIHYPTHLFSLPFKTVVLTVMYRGVPTPTPPPPSHLSIMNATRFSQSRGHASPTLIMVHPHSSSRLRDNLCQCSESVAVEGMVWLRALAPLRCVRKNLFLALWGMLLFVGCLTSQQFASVSQGRICSDNFTCCHTEIEVADPTFHLTQSQYTDTRPTSPCTDPITPDA